MKYVIELTDGAQMVQELAERDGHVISIMAYVDNLEPLTAEYVNEHFGDLQDTAYQKGLEDCRKEIGFNEQSIAEMAYSKGMADAWDAARCVFDLDMKEREKLFAASFSNDVIHDHEARYVKQKLDEYKAKKDRFKISDIITDGNKSYLVIDITDKSYVAIQGTDFEPVYIGKEVKGFYNTNDGKDMSKLTNEFIKAERRMKEMQS